MSMLTSFSTAVIAVLALLTTAAAHGARVEDKSLNWPGQTLSGNACYGSKQGQGPWDYTDPNEHAVPRSGGRSKITTVEDFHFTKKVESLQSGLTNTDPYGDIAYTLRAYPNHHRALWAMIRYYLRRLKQGDQEYLLSMEYRGEPPIPPECHLNRAVSFSPEDGTVRMIYGLYLHKRNKYEAALTRYGEAEKIMPENAELAYNIGLLHIEMHNLDAAKLYAKKAEALGYPLQGLKNKINRSANSKPGESRSQ